MVMLLMSSISVGNSFPTVFSCETIVLSVAERTSAHCSGNIESMFELCRKFNLSRLSFIWSPELELEPRVSLSEFPDVGEYAADGVSCF